MLINNTLVSHPSDTVFDTETNITYASAREITTIICVHDYECYPKNCNNHGDCLHGACHCHGNWAGPACSHVQCGALNCSGHGVCTERGCKCGRGWLGEDCNVSCSPGTYGMGCAQPCQCANNAYCDPVDGNCRCTPGYAGLLCDQECPYGFFGRNCRQICYCKNSCSCHHITGDCKVSYEGSDFWLASKCLAENYIAGRNLVPENIEQYRLWVITTVLLATIAAISIIINISLLCLNCTCAISTPDVIKRQKQRLYSSGNIAYSRPNREYRTSSKAPIQALLSARSSSIHSSIFSSTDIESDDKTEGGSEEVDTTNAKVAKKSFLSDSSALKPRKVESHLNSQKVRNLDWLGKEVPSSIQAVKPYRDNPSSGDGL